MQYLFYHLFYRVYWWNIKVIKEKDIPVLFAYALVSGLMGINLMSITACYLVFIIENPRAFPSWQHWIFIAIVCIPNYFIFIYKRKYKNIISDSESLSKEEKRKRDVAILFYIVTTLVFFIFIVNASQDLLFRQGTLIK
jgi:hypothetical protein